MSMCISIAPARAKCGSQSRDPFGARHFSYKFSHKMAPVTCPCAFKTALARTKCGSRSGDPFGARFLKINSRIRWLL